MAPDRVELSVKEEPEAATHFTLTLVALVIVKTASATFEETL